MTLSVAAAYAEINRIRREGAYALGDVRATFSPVIGKDLLCDGSSYLKSAFPTLVASGLELDHPETAKMPWEVVVNPTGTTSNARIGQGFASKSTGTLFLTPDTSFSTAVYWRSTDQGLTWSRPTSPVPFYGGISEGMGGRLFALGGASGSSVNRVYRSDNDGVSWTLAYTMPHSELTGATGRAPLIITAGLVTLIESGSGYYHRSLDDGVTWTTQAHAATTNGGGTAFGWIHYDGPVWYCAGGNTLIRSPDNGHTWNPGGTNSVLGFPGACIAKARDGKIWFMFAGTPARVQAFNPLTNTVSDPATISAGTTDFIQTDGRTVLMGNSSAPTVRYSSDPDSSTWSTVNVPGVTGTAASCSGAVFLGDYIYLVPKTGINLFRLSLSTAKQSFQVPSIPSLDARRYYMRAA